MLYRSERLLTAGALVRVGVRVRVRVSSTDSALGQCVAKSA